jgi:type II secretory pathway component PulF
MTADPIAAFAFSAQSTAGEPLTGTINAADVTDASRKLHALQLRVVELDPIRSQVQKGKRLDGDDFAAFNTQLAYLATAGLPIEKSMRLIADDMRTGALSQTVNQVAADLESGRSLPEAFAQHAKQFPPLYSQLLNAGIRTGNLPGMLLGLGRHLDMTRRLRGMLWRAASYPLVVFASLLMVVAFLGIIVFPQFKAIFFDFKVELPVITQLAMSFSDFLVSDWPILLGILIAVVIGPPILLGSVKSPLAQQQIKEFILIPIPVIGPAVKRNLLARWCDALKLGVEAGLDLPAAITLAGQAVGSPRLIRDGQILVETLSAGQPLDDKVKTRWIPQTVLVVLSAAERNHDLPSGLNTLSLMFQQQAEMKMATIPTVLTPLLIILIACIIGFVVVAMFAPMIALIQSVSGPQKN